MKPSMTAGQERDQAEYLDALKRFGNIHPQVKTQLENRSGYVHPNPYQYTRNDAYAVATYIYLKNPVKLWS